MRYIKILNNKKKHIDSINQEPTINDVKTELKDGQLHLYIEGENLKDDSTYEWKITFNDELTITPSSRGLSLTLSKNNTNKYVKADKVNVIITVGDYTSSVFTI